jgi:hypothetical protein
MWSFKHKKVYTMSDPRHFDTILPFLQPGDVSPSRPRLFKLDRAAPVLCRRSLQLLPRHQIRGRTYHFLIRGSKG